VNARPVAWGTVSRSRIAGSDQIDGVNGILTVKA